MSELGLVSVKWVKILYYIAALEHIIHTHFKLLLFPRYIFPWNRQINFETRLECYCSFDIAKICKFGGKYSVKSETLKKLENFISTTLCASFKKVHKWKQNNAHLKTKRIFDVPPSFLLPFQEGVVYSKPITIPFYLPALSPFLLPHFCK